MNSRDSNQQKYNDAGEQAGRVISEFISIADNFSRRIEKEFSAKDRRCGSASRNDGAYHDDAKNNGNPSDSEACSRVDKEYRNKGFSSDREAPVYEKSDLENDWHNAGEYLRELREAAGYTVDGFAKAMNRHDAAKKIKSVEEGREIFPDDWLDQISALLKQSDPMEFFERLRGLYSEETREDANEVTNEVTGGNGYGTNASSAGSNPDSLSVAKQRKQKLQNIISDDQLEGLSENQFEELLSFVEINFQSALQLVREK